jgi:site-specific recombinase XerC
MDRTTYLGRCTDKAHLENGLCVHSRGRSGRAAAHADGSSCGKGYRDVRWSNQWSTSHRNTNQLRPRRMRYAAALSMIDTSRQVRGLCHSLGGGCQCSTPV